MRIAVVVFDGFDELDAIGPLEVLRNGAKEGADLQLDLVSLDGTAEVTGSHGLRVRPDGRLDPARTDLLVVPGGGWNDRAPQGAGLADVVAAEIEHPRQGEVWRATPGRSPAR